MAFDEQGQADTEERKVEICTANKLLTEEVGFPPEDIVFDPHLRRRYRHRGARQLRRRLHRGDAADQRDASARPHFRRRIQPLSFSFRGNEPVREAMHAVFLYHAIQAGMDMGIVNAGQLAVYDSSSPSCARPART